MTLFLECPICLHMVDWDTAPLMTLDDQGIATPLAEVSNESPAGRRLSMHAAYRACPGEAPTHYLPNDYGEYYENRIIVGIIGHSGAGKTHLLAAMIGQFMRGLRLRPLGFQVDPLDLRVHRQYVRTRVEPFLDRRMKLERTQLVDVSVTDALLVTNLDTGRRYPVAFFDVSGEQLERGARFIGAVNALIFVVDPQAIRGLLREPEAGTEGDPTFDVALGMLRQARAELGAPFLDIPAAIVVAKADLLRARDPIVDKWLRYEADEDIDLSTVEEESGDVFSYLYTHGAERWLEAAEQCSDSTLHFASAAGTALRDGEFPAESFRPRRVLKPLLSLLAMKDVHSADLGRAG